MDRSLRELERRLRETGAAEDNFAYRLARKRAGESGGLDLSLSHGFSVVGAPGCPTYGEGLGRLRRDDDGSGLQPFFNGRSRPFTFAENLRARLEDDKSPLWDSYLNSCTGILYKGNPKGGVVKFKIIQISEGLLGLPENFSREYVPLNFDAIETEETFRTDSVVCNQVLTPDMARGHRAWLAAAGYDQKLLNDYVKRAEAKAREQGNNLEEFFMNFWTVEKPKTDQLRSLVVDNGYSSSAYGVDHLYNGGRFARVGLQ